MVGARIREGTGPRLIPSKELWVIRLRRSGRGCCLGCLWLFVVALLIYGWEGSAWPLRGLELLTAVLVVAAAIAYRQRSCVTAGTTVGTTA
ncbi:MAG: hypothetical protein WAO09_03605 [Candidatus Dormiibacterota bacterium]|jgi:hypothetical protein